MKLKEYYFQEFDDLTILWVKLLTMLDLDPNADENANGVELYDGDEESVEIRRNGKEIGRIEWGSRGSLCIAEIYVNGVRRGSFTTLN